LGGKKNKGQKGRLSSNKGKITFLWGGKKWVVLSKGKEERRKTKRRGGKGNLPVP